MNYDIEDLINDAKNENGQVYQKIREQAKSLRELQIEINRLKLDNDRLRLENISLGTDLRQAKESIYSYPYVLRKIADYIESQDKYRIESQGK